MHSGGMLMSPAWTGLVEHQRNVFPSAHSQRPYDLVLTNRTYLNSPCQPLVLSAGPADLACIRPCYWEEDTVASIGD
jgi:hypothetical protein